MAERKSIEVLVGECMDRTDVAIRQIVGAAIGAGYTGRELMGVAKEVHRRIWNEIGEDQGVCLQDESERGVLFQKVLTEVGV